MRTYISKLSPLRQIQEYGRLAAEATRAVDGLLPKGLFNSEVALLKTAQQHITTEYFAIVGFVSFVLALCLLSLLIFASLRFVVCCLIAYFVLDLGELIITRAIQKHIGTITISFVWPTIFYWLLVIWIGYNLSYACIAKLYTIIVFWIAVFCANTWYWVRFFVFLYCLRGYHLMPTR